MATVKLKVTTGRKDIAKVDLTVSSVKEEVALGTYLLLLVGGDKPKPDDSESLRKLKEAGGAYLAAVREAYPPEQK